MDSRIRTLVENGVKLNHRSLFVIVGDKGRDQVWHVMMLFYNYTSNHGFLYEGCQSALHAVQNRGKGSTFCSLVLQNGFVPELTP